MDADEREIIHYLSTWGENFVHAKEIARRASSKKRFVQEPDWAKPMLSRLQENRIVESDCNGRYRLVPGHDDEEEWVAPDIEKLLQEDGEVVEPAHGDAPEKSDDDNF
jgi:hypothetical protein